MKVHLEVENPAIIEMTMTITMPLQEWEELREEIGNKYPGWKFKEEIYHLINMAEKHFYQKGD